ncbi:hypothetical protein EDD68_1359 [Melghiribacillus thermohalophilus]|uniref:YkoP-like domain-containing protein n=1 Tax=Melghiribacillus thermohalophilus TaxID=1324956 RepID=A0A4R3MM31_9BACI|nr:hypothetical protein [Melghiribacillus thermohalophilus]TCT15975.1 hypothetical protein EDD68_1359 [Melghiribacillus thermohalophilus]
MRSYLIKLWNAFDPVYYHLTRLRYLDSRHGPKKNVFRVRLTRYKGKPVTLSDGTSIQKNDLLVKVHLHNVRLLNELQSIENEVRRGLIIHQLVKDSLPGVASYISRHRRRNEIKGIIGITMLSKGIKRLGFEAYSIDHPLYKIVKSTALILIYFLSLSSPSIDHLKNCPNPKYLFMSKDMLIKKYLSTEHH